MNEAPVSPSKICTVCGARYPSDALFCAIDGAPLLSGTVPRGEQDPYLGQEISGHIEIRQLVGIGAMGRVYRAFQRGIDRDVAVKILHRELSANAQLVTRFTREAKVASRLQHPNVVQVLLAGQLPDRALYMVMEYLDGLSLQSALAAVSGALPLPRALHVTLQLCEAVGEAHAQGIVHRDLKPENVMLVRRGGDGDFVKVLDFGIARINWGEQSVATAAGLIFGTARYISPEGAQGNSVGPASDVYSIATLLYQMLSGRTPFEGDQAVGLLVQQIHDVPPPLRSLDRARYVPEPIADVIMTNLAKDAARREADARAFGHALLDAVKQAGLAPDEISRPLLRRSAGAMKLPSVERTKQHEVPPELAVRLSLPEAKSNGNAARPPMGATKKWEPPADFQARLNASSEESSRPSGVVAASANPPPAVALDAPSSAQDLSAVPPAVGSRPRSPSGVDDTLDDASCETPNGGVRSVTPSFPAVPSAPASDRSYPKTMPGDETRGPTQYATPAEHVTVTPAPVRAPSDPFLRQRSSSLPPPSSALPRSSPRGFFFVVLCFVLGAGLAAGVAWKMGKLGGDDGDERFVARATDAMFKNRFMDPPGENVRDITDEGLRRFPNDRRLIDVRVRAAGELVTRAQAQRTAGDVAEALRLARAARQLDPDDAATARLVDAYESELASTGTQAVSAPLPTPSLGGAPPPGKTVPAAVAASSYKVLVDPSTSQPRLGQTVEFTARVFPSKGTFEGAAFTMTGPGLGGGVRMPAQSSAPGVFKASYAFLEGGKFEVLFTTDAAGKTLRATRHVHVGGGAGGSAAPSATSPSSPPTAPVPSTTASVKWM